MQRRKPIALAVFALAVTALAMTLAAPGAGAAPAPASHPSSPPAIPTVLAMAPVTPDPVTPDPVTTDQVAPDPVTTDQVTTDQVTAARPVEPTGPAAAALPDPDTTIIASASSISVNVSAVEGATRSVELLDATGITVAGPVEVAGQTIVFDGLTPGRYDVLVEQLAADGASSVTRTVVSVDAAGTDVVER